MYKFIRMHPEFFDNSVSYKFIEYDDEEFPVYDEPLNFNDKIHNINGIINSSYSNQKNAKGEIIHNFIFTLHIKKGENHYKCYITQLNNYIQTQSKFGNIVDLNYYKIMNNSLVIHNYYNNTIDKWVDDCKSIEDGYFSNHKQFIFSIMKQKNNYNINTSNNWNNIILEGSHGLGKSTLIYRLAVLLKRNIISLDLTLYLDKKKELYAIFHGNDFKLPDDDTKIYNINDNIIVLEEFDNTIMKLVELEKIYQIKIDLIEKFQINKQNLLAATMKKTEFKTKENTDIVDNDNYLTAAKESIDNSRKFDNNLHTINGDVDNVIKIHKEFHKNDVLRLGDLLELFQGSIPIKDRMIIATTNHFNKIKEFLPALFRNGRMTPLAFSYLDWDSFVELCQFYFHTNPTNNKFEIILPTSQLIEMALKIQSINGNVKQFEQDINLVQKKIIDSKQQSIESEEPKIIKLEEPKSIELEEPKQRIIESVEDVPIITNNYDLMRMDILELLKTNQI